MNTRFPKRLLRGSIAGLVVLLYLASAVATASAAVPTATSYELPKATHAGGVTVAADGRAWFVARRGTEWEGRGHSLGSVAPDGSYSERVVPGFSALGRVVASRGDGLWVSGHSGSRYGKPFLRIAHLSAAGAVKRTYQVRHGEGGIRSMDASPGAIWFIETTLDREAGSNSIARLTPSTGAIRRFPLPPHCRALALAVADDGTPWFSEKCGGFADAGDSSKTSISRIDPHGKIVQRRIAARDYPISLAIGPEGTVWFGAWRYYQPSQLGHLSAAGKITEIPLGSNGSPYSIAVGPEGNLWFETSFPHKLYRRALNSIDLDGRMGTPICADPDCRDEATEIATAPDGSLWYGLAYPNKNTGGGGSGLYISELIGNEAGFLGHLAFQPPD
jgi:streptogramin lyase